MTGRGVLYLLLAVVAGAAAMLSFAALRDLALRCGFAPVLAWLLPVVVDAGAAAGSLVWLREGAAGTARRFARRLALGLLGLSVAANALGHALAAFALAPPWWVVVILSGIAPAVLGAMVHLAVLVGRPDQREPDTQPFALDERIETPATEPPGVEPLGDVELAAGPVQPQASPREDECLPADAEPGERAAALIAAGAGRRRLSRELGVTEYEARRLLDRTRPTTTDDVPSGAVDHDPATAAPDTAGSRPVLAGAPS